MAGSFVVGSAWEHSGSFPLLCITPNRVAMPQCHFLLTPAPKMQVVRELHVPEGWPAASSDNHLALLTNEAVQVGLGT